MEFLLFALVGVALAYFVIYYAVLNAINESKNPSRVKRLRSKDDA